MFYNSPLKKWLTDYRQQQNIRVYCFNNRNSTMHSSFHTFLQNILKELEIIAEFLIWKLPVDFLDSSFKLHCKLRNFCENDIFANSLKRHICQGKNSRLRHDLATSRKWTERFHISGEFYFHETLHLRSFMKIKPSRNFSN